MTAGLACVVSDWDGYRDTVVDGETGIRIPTWMPGAGTGAALADAYAVLRDPVTRRRYGALQAGGFPGVAGGGCAAGGGPPLP